MIKRRDIRETKISLEINKESSNDALLSRINHPIQMIDRMDFVRGRSNVRERERENKTRNCFLSFCLMRETKFIFLSVFGWNMQ